MAYTLLPLCWTKASEELYAIKQSIEPFPITLSLESPVLSLRTNLRVVD